MVADLALPTTTTAAATIVIATDETTDETTAEIEEDTEPTMADHHHHHHVGTATDTKTDIEIGGQDRGRQVMAETDTAAAVHVARPRTICLYHAANLAMCQTCRSSHSTSWSATSYLGSRKRSQAKVFAWMY